MFDQHPTMLLRRSAPVHVMPAVPVEAPHPADTQPGPGTGAAGTGPTGPPAAGSAQAPCGPADLLPYSCATAAARGDATDAYPGLLGLRPGPRRLPEGPVAWALGAALLLDVLCLLHLLDPPHAVQPLRPYLLSAAHLAASGPAAMCLQRWLLSEEHPRLRGRLLLLLLFAVSFLLPVLGPLGVLLRFRLAPPPRRPAPVPQRIASVCIPDLPEKPDARLQHHQGDRRALRGVLLHAPDQQRRLAAVQQLAGMPGREALDVLRLALRDPADQVRHQAYAVLQKRERDFTARIKQLLTELEQAPRQQRQQLQLRLAEAYWELAEAGPPIGGCAEMESYVLKTARQHAEAAVELQPADAEAHFLLGRVLLKGGRAELAHTSFLRAMSWGMAQVKVLPHLAEVAFQQREFAAVKRYMQGVDDATCRAQPGLQAVKARWR